MGKYWNVLKAAWAETEEWYKKGIFNPQREADVQSFLYRCCVNRLEDATKINAYATYGPDLDIRKRLLVEIKLFRWGKRKSEASWQRKIKRVKKDVGKLVERSKGLRHGRLPVMIVFNKKHSEDDMKFVRKLKNYCRKENVRLLYGPT